MAVALTIPERFGLTLRRLREQASLSQQELADEVGVSQMTISRYERGVTDPLLTHVVGIAIALKVDVQTLLGGDGEDDSE